MHDIRQKMHVALSPSPSTVLAERLLLSKLQNQQLHIMDIIGIARVSDSGALLQIRVVSGKAEKLHHDKTAFKH